MLFLPSPAGFLSIAICSHDARPAKPDPKLNAAFLCESSYKYTDIL